MNYEDGKSRNMFHRSLLLLLYIIQKRSEAWRFMWPLAFMPKSIVRHMMDDGFMGLTTGSGANRGRDLELWEGESANLATECVKPPYIRPSDSFEIVTISHND